MTTTEFADVNNRLVTRTLQPHPLVLWPLAILLVMMTFSVLSQPHPATQLKVVTLQITSITPQPASIAEKITVFYRLQTTPLVHQPIVGVISGTFQGKALSQLTTGSNQTITVSPDSPADGSFYINGQQIGDGTVTLYFNTPSNCNLKTHFGKCPDTLIAEASAPLSIPPRMVTRRISGQSYVDFAKGDSSPNNYVASGVMCVVHSPSCGSTGKNGNDHYFPADRALPATVHLLGQSVQIFWPIDQNGRVLLDHTDRGSVGSQGSYGAAVDWLGPSAVPPLSVHWENTCQNSYPPINPDWEGLPVTYQVSFTVSMPENAVLSEPSFDSSTAAPSVCAAADKPVRIVTAPTPAPPAAKQWILALSGPNYTPLNPKINAAFSATISIINSGNVTSPELTLQFLLDGAPSSSATIHGISAG